MFAVARGEFLLFCTNQHNINEIDYRSKPLINDLQHLRKNFGPKNNFGLSPNYLFKQKSLITVRNKADLDSGKTPKNSN